ncbi:hypothetical protein FB45DRAFT_1083165, partial [Roridomyces roridus]
PLVPLRGPSSPTSLTHICRKWRDIALATPQLWRSILLRAPGDDRVPLEWLERSGLSPLCIQMQLDEQARLHPQTLAAILLHQQQWEYVDLTLGEDEMALLQGPMPLLRVLILSVEDSGSSRRPNINACDFPRLHVLWLDGFIHMQLGDWFPWSQLTSLRLTNMDSSTYLSALNGAVKLVELNLINCFQYGKKDLPDVNLPLLENFLLVDSDSEPYFPRELDTFILPSVHTLQVPAAFLGHEMPLDIFASFVAKSGCASLEKVPITGDSWAISRRAFRRRFPAITFATNGGYDWFKRRRGDEEDDPESDPE